MRSSKRLVFRAVPAVSSTNLTALRSAGAGPEPFCWGAGCSEELEGFGLGFGFADDEGVGVEEAVGVGEA